MIIAAVIGPTPQIVVSDVDDAARAVLMRCFDVSSKSL
ncbi:MAG: Arc/MetJ family transcription regulator [Ilumatobacter sp.]|jgi:hypothetical protein